MFIRYSIIGVIITILIFYFIRFDLSDNNKSVLREQSHPHIDSLLASAKNQRKSRNYAVAVRTAKEAFEQSKNNNYQTGIVKARLIIGYVLGHEAKFDSAIYVLERAREAVLKYKLDRALYHQAGINAALYYADTGQNEIAGRYLDEALKYFLKTDDYYSIASAHNNRGLLYQWAGEYQKAEMTFKRGLPYARKVPDKRYMERSLIGNLGIHYFITGHIDKAIPMIEKSLQMGKEMHDPVSQAIDHRYLGNAQYMKANYKDALNHYLEDARLMERTGENHGIIRAYRNVARVYDALNDLDNALHYYHKAESIVINKLAGKYQHYPEAFRSFGVHWMLRGNFQKAGTYLRKALEGYTLQNMPADIALCHLDLADLYFLERKSKECQAAALSALVIYQQTDAGPNNLCKAFLRLGLAQIIMGDYDSALSYLTRAMKMSQKINAAETTWQAHHYLSTIFLRMGNLDKAIFHSKKAVNILEEIQYYTISPELGSRFLSDKMEVYDQYFKCLYTKYKQAQTHDLIVNLFSLSEQTRGRALRKNIRTGFTSPFSSMDESKSLQHIEKQIILYSRLIREEMTKPENRRHKSLLNSWQKQLRILQQDLEREVTQFKSKNPQISALTGYKQYIRAEEVQSLLQPGEIIIAYHIIPDQAFVFLLGADSIWLRKLDMPPSEIYNYIQNLRKPFEDFKAGKIDFLRIPFDGKASNNLFRRIIYPILPYIQGKEKLIIVPSGPLVYLPFELLVTRSDSLSHGNIEFSDIRRHRFLLEDFTISYLPTTALIPLLKNKVSVQPEKTMLAFGNPVASSKDVRTSQVFNSNMPDLRWIAMTPLPGASREAAEIVRLFSEKDALNLTGAGASEKNYKDQASNYRYIHFATHGYVDNKNANFSALLLNPGHISEDGLLYAYEIYTCPVNCDLVTLSACETALGQYQRGEGLVSFVQAFFTAGSRSVMASLWSVKESSYPLMIAFYRNLKSGMGKANALRQAKLEFMKSYSVTNQDVKYSNYQPFLWAPFVLYGF